MKRELLVPIVVVALSVAFITVSALVVITRAHPALVRRKLRLGAMLLSLTAVSTGGCGPYRSCYVGEFGNGDPYPYVDVEVTCTGADDIDVAAMTDASLKIEVDDSGGLVFSYALLDLNGTVVRQDELVADGPARQRCSIETSNMSSGTYILKVYRCEVDAQPTTVPAMLCHVRISRPQGAD